jgi:hypothetical protein
MQLGMNSNFEMLKGWKPLGYLVEIQRFGFRWSDGKFDEVLAERKCGQPEIGKVVIFGFADTEVHLSYRVTKAKKFSHQGQCKVHFVPSKSISVSVR